MDADDDEVLVRSYSLPLAPLAPLPPLGHSMRAHTPNTDPGVPSFDRTTSHSSNPPRAPLVRQNSISSNSGILVRTTSGFQIGLVPPEQLRELQCGVCGGLIQSAVHAPCGHSFCQSHLEADESARNELEMQAQRIRELTADGRFLLSRAREALAVVADGPLPQALELCQKLSGLEGRAVRVKPDVKEPKFEWGVISHKSVGVVTKDEPSQDGDRQAWVHFPEYNRWHCLTEELEIHPDADKVIQKGSRVRFIAGVTPKMGWGPMDVDGSGVVFCNIGCQVRFMTDEGVHFAFVDELELVDDFVDPVAAALNRLQAGEPKEQVLKQLHAFLKEASEAADGTDILLVAQGRDYQSFMRTFGAFDLLRAIGLRVTHYSKTTLYVFRYVPPRLGCEDLGPVPPRARYALEELKKRFDPLPEPAAPLSMRRFKVDLALDPEFFLGVPVEEVYQDQLRHPLLSAIAPQGEGWSWPQRGWASEKAMLQNLVTCLPSGRAAVAVNQTEDEAKAICRRLLEHNLTGTLQEETFFDPLVSAEREVCTSWQGDIPLGARVRLSAAQEAVPSEGFDRSTICIVNGQILMGEGGNRTLHYFLVAPKTPTMKPIPSEGIDIVTLASNIQPGARVRVNPPPGKEPVFGWGRVQGSDIGIVQNVHQDGAVEVFFIAEEQHWKGALQDLDTHDLPQVVRTDCPVCSRAFPAGQKLAVDIAMDAQIRRMQNLLAGARLEKNPSGKTVARPGAAKLLRSRTHQEELRCNICFDLLVSPVTLPCGHSYCKHHIQIWLMENDKCPVCRVRVLHYKDHPAQPKHALRTTAAVFQATLEDEEGKGGSKQDDGLELHVNEMLEKQVIRFFPEESKQRSPEVAAEVWEVIQKRQDGSLGRLRFFLQQFRSEGAAELLKLSSDGPDQPLPGTRNGTLLMMACELGLADVAHLLLEHKANATHTTEAAFGPGTSPLQLAAGQGKAEVVRMLLNASQWPSQLCADALGAAIERNQAECAQLLLQQQGIAEVRNCMDFTAMLTAVQAGNTQIVSMLIDWKADLEARTAHSGLMVSKAGCAKVNGPYQRIGEMNGRPLYANLLGAVVFCRDWWKIAESQELAERSDEPFGYIYSMPAPHTETLEPPAGQWTMDGVRPDPNRPCLPAPIVERLAEEGQAATPLLLAAQLGLGGVVELLLGARAHVDVRLPESRRSALHIAAAVGDMGVLKVLLNTSTGTLDLSPRDAANLTPLHLACHSGHTLVVRALLDAKVSPQGFDAAPFGPISPLIVASGCGQMPLHIETAPPGAPNAYLTIVTTLLDASADAGLVGCLQAAAAAGNVLVVSELVHRGANPSAPETLHDGTMGYAPLLAGLMKGSRSPATDDIGPQAQVARKLLELSADARAQHTDGVTALMAAAALGDVELIQAMVAGGADLAAARTSCTSFSRGCVVVAREKSGWKLLDGLLNDVAGTSTVLPGAPLCLKGHAMERLAKERCTRRPVCDRCRRNNIHSSAVFWTCWPCDHDLCLSCASVPSMVCVPAQCNLNDLPNDTCLPAHLRDALQSQSSSFVITALEGWQALHHAVVTGKRKAVQALLDAGAFASAPDAQGLTPLHWAVLLGHHGNAEVLLNSGASPAIPDVHGRVPLALMETETLRYVFAAEATDFREACAHELKVKGTGIADGDYIIVQATAQTNGTTTAATNADTAPLEGPQGLPDADAGASSTAGGVDAATSTEAHDAAPAITRPQYKRKDGTPFVLMWTEANGWGIWQRRHPQPSLLCFVSGNKDAWRCPLGEWKASNDIQIEEEVEVKVMDGNPWRVGTRLFQCTPPELRTHNLREAVEALPAVEPEPDVQPQISLQIGNGVSHMTFPLNGMTFPMGLPPGMMMGALPGGQRPDQLFQTVEEMLRSGGGMTMPMQPGGNGPLGATPPGCPQQ